jgi:hypothetical protein
MKSEGPNLGAAVSAIVKNGGEDSPIEVAAKPPSFAVHSKNGELEDSQYQAILSYMPSEDDFRYANPGKYSFFG